MTREADQQIDALINRHEASWRVGYHAFPDVLNQLDLKRGVEVGVAFGGHSESILKNTGVTKLIAVDSYQHRDDYDDPMNLAQPVFDRLAQRVVDRLAPFGDRFELLRKESAQAGVQLDNESLDFVYLDADHSEAGVLADLCTWASKVRIGGVIAGHDYGHPDFPGVKRSIDRFFNRFGWQIHEAGHHVWWVQRQPLPITYFTPSYNCADSVRASAQSVLEQLNPGDEYILVNDGSTDDSAKVLDDLAAQHPAVRVIHHATNRGGAATRNTAIATASHALCFCLDADNLLLPGSIDALRDRMMTCDADVVAFQETKFFTNDNGPKAPTHSHILDESPYGLAQYLSTHRVPGSGGNHLFTRACWQAVEGYPEDAHALDTWGFGLRLAGAGFKTYTAPGTAYLHRYSPDSYWNRHVKTGTVNQVAYQLVLPYLDQIHPTDVRYLASDKGQSQWFTSLEQRPLRLRLAAPIPTHDTPIVYVKKSLHWLRRKMSPAAKAA